MGALPAETGETPPPSDGTLGHNDAPPKDQEKQRVLWSEMCDDESGEFEEVKQKKKRQRRRKNKGAGNGSGAKEGAGKSTKGAKGANDANEGASAAQSDPVESKEATQEKPQREFRHLVAPPPETPAWGGVPEVENLVALDQIIQDERRAQQQTQQQKNVGNVRENRGRGGRRGRGGQRGGFGRGGRNQRQQHDNVQQRNQSAQPG